MPESSSANSGDSGSSDSSDSDAEKKSKKQHKSKEKKKSLKSKEKKKKRKQMKKKRKRDDSSSSPERKTSKDRKKARHRQHETVSNGGEALAGTTGRGTVGAAIPGKPDSWKGQLLGGAAAAQARLDSGELQRKLFELDSVENAYGGLAVDWRQRKRLERELSALQRMVATGAKLIVDDQAERSRIAAFKQSMGLPVDSLPRGGLSASAASGEDAGWAASTVAAATKASAPREIAAERTRLERTVPARVQGPQGPPRGFYGDYDPIRR